MGQQWGGEIEEYYVSEVAEFCRWEHKLCFEDIWVHQIHDNSENMLQWSKKWNFVITVQLFQN